MTSVYRFEYEMLTDITNNNIKLRKYNLFTLRGYVSQSDPLLVAKAYHIWVNLIIICWVTKPIIHIVFSYSAYSIMIL
jgi:hypothetical protein